MPRSTSSFAVAIVVFCASMPSPACGKEGGETASSRPAGRSTGGGEQDAEFRGQGPTETGAPREATRSPEPVVQVESFDVRAISVSEAENGKGELALAVNPLVFELRVSARPEDVQDPVLHIGDLRFEQYEKPELGVLRYVAADAGQLSEGARVELLYGEDEETSVLVTESLKLP